MNLKIPAILFSLLLLVVAVLLVVNGNGSKVLAGDESWAEIAICAIDTSDTSQIPEGYQQHLAELEDVLRSQSIKDRVAELFREVLPDANCKLQIESIRLEPVADTNRVVLRMTTSNPLLGAALLREVLVRSELEFQGRTGLAQDSSADLLRLKQKQKEFERRVNGVRDELDQLLRSGSSDQVKVQSLRSQLENFEKMDQMMREQLDSIESMGDGMVFSEPVLKFVTVQRPTFDRVGLYQLQQYDAIQKENHKLLSSLTPAMQDALERGTGFTVE